MRTSCARSSDPTGRRPSAEVLGYERAWLYDTTALGVAGACSRLGLHCGWPYGLARGDLPLVVPNSVALVVTAGTIDVVPGHRR
jgi:hypothetical protein